MGDLRILMLEVGMLGTNCYILMDQSSKEGYIIDPGGEARKIVQAAEDAALDCLGILCTHGHMDHVGSVGKVAEAMDARVYISSKDAGMLEGSHRSIGGRIGSLLISRPDGVEYIEGGDEIVFGEHSIKVLNTPGHTTGSVSFLCEDNLFCGDLVFQGSIGRTDLKGGSMEQLLQSVRGEVFVLPPSTTIFPGHGPATTVEEEMAMNPFLRNIRPGV